MENLNSLNNQIFKNFEVILISENNINIDITNYEFEISIFKKVKNANLEKKGIFSKNCKWRISSFYMMMHIQIRTG